MSRRVAVLRSAFAKRVGRMLRGERKRRKYGVFRIGGTEAQRPQFYWRTGRTGGDNPDTEGCVVGALCENTRSSSFMVVEEPELIGRIARMRDYGSAFVEKAPLVILVMGDQLRSDLWEVNAAISATYVQLAAQALELGSCWVHVAGRPRRREEPRRPRRRGLSAFVPASTGEQAHSVCSGDRAYGRTGPYPKGGDTRRG